MTDTTAATGVPRVRSGKEGGVFGLSRSQSVALAVMTLAVLVAPALLYPVFVMKLMCFALFACSFNLLFGYAGLMSFGHAAFFGAGSYVVAGTMNHWGLPADLAVLLAALVGAAIGLLFGLVAIRRQGLYFAMITLALAQLLYFVCLQVPWTGGENGLQIVHRGRIFGLISIESDRDLYWVVAVLFLAGFLLVARIIASPFGQVLKAIRDNEQRVKSLGYRVDLYKLVAFVLSASLAAVAGGLKALVLGLATLTDVHFGTSGEVVLMALMGGIGTMFGPVVGAIMANTMWNYLSQFGSWVVVIQGTIFVLCVLVFRRGVVGALNLKLKLKL